MTITDSYAIMETKMKGFVSKVKKEIITTAIESLRTEGLRFSVDTIAAKLKISKKTVYKFFPDKEALAHAIYETYYAGAAEKARKIAEQGDEKEYRLLMIYHDAGFMMRREIFNKYRLNDSVYAYAAKLHEALWSEILPCIAPGASQTDAAILKAITEGAFEKADACALPAESVCRKLVTLL